MGFSSASWTTKFSSILLFVIFATGISGCSWIQGNVTRSEIGNSGTVSYCVEDKLTNTPYAGGSGTSADPFTICTTTQFKKIGQTPADWGKNFLLKANISLASETLASYSTIGISGSDFTGIFDGGGNTISGLNITNAISDFGLFAFASNGATFKNLTLSSFNVRSAFGSVGALVSYVNAGTVTIENVTISNSKISGDDGGGTVGFGAIVGYALSPATVVITNSSSSNNSVIQYSGGGPTYMGGLIGFADNASIS